MLKAHHAEMDVPDGKDFMGNTGAGRRNWYLASDGSLCQLGNGNGKCAIEDKLREHGALTLNPAEWFKPPHAMDLAQFKGEFDPALTYEGYIGTVVDLWAATQADFYFGKVYSTFDESACFLRGPEKTSRSNICEGVLGHLQCKNRIGPACPERICHACTSSSSAKASDECRPT